VVKGVIVVILIRKVLKNEKLYYTPVCSHRVTANAEGVMVKLPRCERVQPNIGVINLAEGSNAKSDATMCMIAESLAKPSRQC